MERLILRAVLYCWLLGAKVNPTQMGDHKDLYFLLATGFLACSARQTGTLLDRLWSKPPEQTSESEAIQERVLKRLKEGK
jgi:hypothetical protein